MIVSSVPRAIGRAIGRAIAELSHLAEQLVAAVFQPSLEHPELHSVRPNIRSWHGRRDEDEDEDEEVGVEVGG